jgi:hypothetical protein
MSLRVAAFPGTARQGRCALGGEAISLKQEIASGIRPRNDI